MKRVPAGALIVASASAPRATRPRSTTLAVISPRSPGPSGLHARLIFIPRVAKSLNACVLKFNRSA